MPDDPKPFHNPFAALSQLRASMPEVPAPPAVATPAEPPPGVKSISRAVIRLERTGRGGKEVTVIEQLGLRPAEMDAWLKTLKSSLGCGGTVEDATIVLQGDQRKRLPELLTKRGVKRVTVG